MNITISININIDRKGSNRFPNIDNVMTHVLNLVDKELGIEVNNNFKKYTIKPFYIYCK